MVCYQQVGCKGARRRPRLTSYTFLSSADISRHMAPSFLPTSPRARPGFSSAGQHQGSAARKQHDTG